MPHSIVPQVLRICSRQDCRQPIPVNRFLPPKLLEILEWQFRAGLEFAGRPATLVRSLEDVEDTIKVNPLSPDKSAGRSAPFGSSLAESVV